MFAEIILSKVSRGIDKIFHYSIPRELVADIKIGHQVLVPFGRRTDLGYVVGFVEKAEVKNVKDILSIASEHPVFTKEQVELAKWLADYYCSFFLTALRLVMPPGTSQREGRRPKIQGQRPEAKEVKQTQSPMTPTPEQQAALQAIKQALDQSRPEKYLLYGVTGSGKTEVYLQAVAHALAKGKSAIVLVPEISLTPQLVERFQARFGDHIAVLHSHLTQKQRRDEWQRIATGEAKIILGARSAVFAPVKNLGLIVIDEEFETSYKQDKSPRYHAREVAGFLAGQHQAVVILGSATPSVETFYKAEQGEYQKLVLAKRIDDRPLPPVEVIDMRRQGRFLLSKELREELKTTLAKGEQAILFINRRGFYTFVMCRACGNPIECPDCAISLSYHSDSQQVLCNRCDYRAAVPSTCPRCNSSSIAYFGIGTQRIENEVAQVFPQARILRYDTDSVSKRGSHETFFAAFAEHKADVLIGTQMVTKGLDVANVTLVGVVSADTALQLPDFRSAEHTFQLLTQVAGRAGRHHLPGKVIIQTYTPEHYAIKTATGHDYEAFYAQEIKHRQELSYPPFARLISLLISGPEASKVEKIAADLGQFLRKRLAKQVLGPASAVIPRLRGQWRWQILLKGKDLGLLRQAVQETLAKVVVPQEIRVTVDVEPMGLL
ncbi:MAG: primosomal protein N' [Candidatus Margulisbacteria bacterium]|nr:primosomal protein N' [Candidatus Margulisiibacteriota bacterium]